MRKIFILLMVLCAFGIKAQNVWQPDSIIQAPDKTQEQIIACATQWAASNFAEFSPTITSDETSLTVMLNLPFKINNMTWAAGSGYITGQVKIQAREGRFKISLSNFNHFSTNKQYTDWWSMGLILESTPEQWIKGGKWKQKREVYKRVLEKLNSFSQSVFTSAATSIPSCTPVVEEDW